MIYIGWIIIFLLGISTINALASKTKLLEKIGFSMPIGIGVSSLLTMMLDIVGVAINQVNVFLAVSLLTIILLNAFTLYKNKTVYSIDPLLKVLHPKNLLPINLGFLLLISVAIFIVYGVVSKSLFWPVFIYDSVNGYDFIAKAMMREGTLNNSLFDASYPLYGIRSIYPPLVPISFSTALLFGHATSKIVTVWFYLSNFIVFYAFLKKYATHLAAALFSLLLVITPEFAAFSSLSSPNPACMFYTAMGTLSLYVWYRDGERSYFNLGTLCIVLALWTRTEAVIFMVAGGFLVLLNAIRTKKFNLLIIYGVFSIAVIALWQWYLNMVLHAESMTPTINHLYWDYDKLSRLVNLIIDVTLKVQYYGIVVYLFLAMLLINSYAIIKEKDKWVLLSIIFIPWITYILVYYQLDDDYTATGPGGFITSGYKRGFFYFLPLLLFYCVNNKVAQKIFNKYLTI